MTEEDRKHDSRPIWISVEVQPEQCYHWQLGPFQLWVKRIEDEWFIASEALADPETEASIEVGSIIPEPEAIEWERWVIKDPDNTLHLAPLMPDRPVVVRPVVPMHIPHGQQASFYVSIPLWIQIAVGKEKSMVLCEKPGIMLSNTWFGNPVEGELCYSLNTKARRELEDCTVKPYRALCPVVIRNDHAKELNFERLCIRTDHLSIYEGDNQLVTNEVNVTYHGEEKLSRIKYGKKPPSLGNIKGKLSDPRKPEDSLIKLSFNSLMSHTFYG